MSSFYPVYSKDFCVWRAEFPERQVGLQEVCPESNMCWETVSERGNVELSIADAVASAGLSSEAGCS